jgi:hypothetical protein
MSLWALVDAMGSSMALPARQGEQHKGKDKRLIDLTHRRAQGHALDPCTPKKDHITRATHKPAKVRKAKDESAGQNGHTATLASDYGMISATPSSGLPCSDEARIQIVSDVLREAVQQAKGSGVFFDLFSGPRAPVTQALKRQGNVCVPFDTLLGHAYDLCAEGVVNLLLAWIESSNVAGISIALPCGSWSSARHGGPGNTCPPPLRERTKKNIYGFKKLSPKDRMRVRLGNATMRSGAVIISKAREYKIPTVMDNGILSMIWYAPEIRSQLSAAVLHTCDYCQHGTRWRRRTHFVAWHTGAARSPVLSRLCSSRRGICDRAGKKHCKLNVWSTSGARARKAEEYPTGIAESTADLLCYKLGSGSAA